MEVSGTSATHRPVGSTLLITLGAVGAVLVALATVGGAELGVYWDGIRLTLLDPVKADDFGYTDETRPRGHCIDRPHGITPDQNGLMFFAGFVGTAVLLAGYLTLAKRCGVVAPGWLGAALVTGPAAAGFYWHSTAWLEPDPDHGWNLAQEALYHGDVWVTALLGIGFVVALGGWLISLRCDLPHDRDEPGDTLPP